MYETRWLLGQVCRHARESVEQVWEVLQRRDIDGFISKDRFAVMKMGIWVAREKGGEYNVAHTKNGLFKGMKEDH